MVLLEVKGLETWFFTRRGVAKAVNGVNFSVDKGESLGLVGESGCGKSVTCLSLLRLVPQPAGQIMDGQVLFDGVDLLSLSEREMRKYRGSQLSMILQDPMTSLNPVFSVGNQVAEVLALHQGLRGESLRRGVLQMLREVWIASPELRYHHYPHQFSGGMRQRVVGAIALACHPRLLICDEPTTSLDATTQVQYLSLLRKLQEERNVALIFITHDFGIVAQMCSRVAVMYAGRIVEMAPVREIFNRPAHPYTRALLLSVPHAEERTDKLFSIEGEAPDLINLPPGCAFLLRCVEKTERCLTDQFPPEVNISDDHMVRCWKHG